MKIDSSHTLISAGAFAASDEWKAILQSIRDAVSQAEWPAAGKPGHKPGVFTIHPESGKKSGEGNGVVPIKLRPMELLKADGWSLEHPWEVGQRGQPDPLVQQAVAEVDTPFEFVSPEVV